MMTKNTRTNPSKSPAPSRQREPEKAPEPSGYFDLHTKGCGYMNRIRWVTPKGSGRKAEKFLACAINAVHGKIADPQYSYMDLRVSGEDAINLVSGLLEDSEADRKIFVAFTVGDIYAHTYWRDIREQGRKTGEQEPAAVIKGRLLLITHIKVDDVVVYQRDPGEQSPVGHSDPGDGDPAGGEPSDDHQVNDDPDPMDDDLPFESSGRISQFPGRHGGPARNPVRESRNTPAPVLRTGFRSRAEA